MKKTLTTIALLAAATLAQAQDITHIARKSTFTVSLTTGSCPSGFVGSLAIHLPYPGTPSYGCWTRSGGKVKLQWFRYGNPGAGVTELPSSEFESLR